MAILRVFLKKVAILFILLPFAKKIKAHVVSSTNNHDFITSPNPEETGPYFQGDIMMPRAALSGLVNSQYRWINQTVHYEFDENYRKASDLHLTFLSAIDHIQGKTCLKFKPRLEMLSSLVSAHPLPKDYIFVTSSISRSCYSYVGRQGGRQVVSLPASCNRLGTFVHELLHAVGFHHEQSRTDRDDYAKIVWENVQPGKESQFRKYDAAMVSSFGVPYDYGSVLHYSQYAFSRSVTNKLETIVPVSASLPEGVEMGQRKGLSESDAEKVNRMYDC